MEDDAAAVEATDWDAIVIGTGMGGGTIGLTLAQAGLKVLLLERGPAEAEAYRAQDISEDPARRMAQGNWPERISAQINGADAPIFAPMGCGAGGSTLLYGAALERFERHDFEALPGVAHPAGGWPFGYDAFRPYYERAEALYRVKGTRDPLSEPDGPAVTRPPTACAQDGVLMRDLARAGLHPYRVHVGIAYKPGCSECLGVPCPNACKSDARTIAVLPAIAAGAELRTGCDVERLIADRTRVTGVEYRRDGVLHRVSARIVVLAAGTYRSAGLLLASRNAAWPDGLANGSGLVGRNLMFHADVLFALWGSARASHGGPRKTIALRDFYLHEGERYGSIQSTGIAANYGNILVFLYGVFDRSPFRALRFIRPFLRIPAKIAATLFGPATILAMLVEDLPYAENRIELDPTSPTRVRVVYNTPDELKRRVAHADRLFRLKLKRFRMFRLSPPGVSLNLGHPTGTCRMGVNPATSVLDPECRAHGIDNLYVVDGSFMPSCGGVNPALTIAANALRVGEAIVRRLCGRG